MERLRFLNWNILQGDHMLKLLYFFIREMLVILCNVGLSYQGALSERKMHVEFRTARLLHDFVLSEELM